MNIPFHPMIVHLPIALTLVLPLIIGVLLWGERRGYFTAKSWIVIVLLQAIIVGSAFAAMRTGEEDEEAVEEIVPESAIEAHEEWGEIFVWTSAAVLVVTLLPLVLKRMYLFKPLALAAALGALVPLIATGHSGGELVYVHGAAQAHVDQAKVGATTDVSQHDDD